MKRHLEIINSINRALDYVIVAILIVIVLLLYIAHSSDASTDSTVMTEPTLTPAPSAVSASKRPWIEETFTSKDLALWDEFHPLEDRGYTDQEAIDQMVEETDISEDLLKDHLQNLLHWIATMDYHYSAEGIKRYILEPAISYHSGTAGSTLQRAQACADILYNITEGHFHLCEDLDHRIEEAVGILTEEERGWLKENLPGLVEEIDGVFESSIQEIYHDAGAYGRISMAMQVEKADEDWTAVKKGLMESLLGS